jgi:hypothetical protein
VAWEKTRRLSPSRGFLPVVSGEERQTVQAATPAKRTSTLSRIPFETRTRVMMCGMDSPKAGETVVLTALPPGLIDGLPEEDQRAIIAVVGRLLLLCGCDEDGRAELEFDDPFDGRPGTFNHTHTIFVAREFIRRHLA